MKRTSGWWHLLPGRLLVTMRTALTPGTSTSRGPLSSTDHPGTSWRKIRWQEAVHQKAKTAGSHSNSLRTGISIWGVADRRQKQAGTCFPICRYQAGGAPVPSTASDPSLSHCEQHVTRPAISRQKASIYRHLDSICGCQDVIGKGGL